VQPNCMGGPSNYKPLAPKNLPTTLKHIYFFYIYLFLQLGNFYSYIISCRLVCCILHLHLGGIQRPHPNRVRQTSIFVAVSGLVLSEDPKAGSGEPAERGSELQPWPWIHPVRWECPGRDVTPDSSHTTEPAL